MCLIKIWVSVLHFSTESAKLQNQQFIPCYSSLHFILLKMTNNKHLKWEISTNQSCSQFATHFDEKPKILTYRQVSRHIFFPEKVFYETVLWFVRLLVRLHGNISFFLFFICLRFRQRPWTIIMMCTLSLNVVYHSKM